MQNSHRKMTRPELYERLLDRLSFALDTAKTAVRLGRAGPVELELRGLSRAEFEWIHAYLNRHGKHMAGSVKVLEQKGVCDSAKVIWLKDRHATPVPLACQ